MTTISLPFEKNYKAENGNSDFLNSELFRKLSPLLQETAEKNPHLLEYLHMVPVSQVGVPEYCTELNRKMGDVKAPNLIYPVGNGTFIHIMVDFQDSRNHYIQIEPTSTGNLDELLKRVEDTCIEQGDQLVDFNVLGDKEKQLCEYIDRVTTLEDEQKVSSFRKYIPFVNKDKDILNKVKLTARELDGVKYLFIRDKIRLGILEPLIADPYIEDIGCSGLGQVYIEHKIFGGLKSTITFYSLDDLDQFVLRLAEKIQKPVNYRAPICDATLPDGSRINIVYGRDVSRRGSNFSIRKFSGVPLSIFDIVDFGTLNYMMLAYLSLVVGDGMNVFVAGESASGKTALLNALTTFIQPLAKIITIEDTPELQVPHQNWIREVVSSSKTKGSDMQVTTFDLLRAALRQRPNEIMVGEIRGPEGNVAFQAMQTGHSVMATFHASDIEKLIQRLTSPPISVPKTYIDNLNVAILTGIMKLPNGRLGRRVTDIAEIVGYDPESKGFNIINSFHWDAETDKFDFTGYMSSYILENKIAPKMGIPNHKKQQIYKEIEKRANVLKRLHLEQGIKGFYEVLEVLSKAQKEGLF
jgi:archaeal flagellar protein FlaI